MKRALIPVIALLSLVGCSSHIKQFYPDSFFKEDAVYQNKPLRFTLTFKENWAIDTDPNYMMRSLRSVAKAHQKLGGELLFVGSTVDGLQGVKGIAMNLNMDNWEYAKNIQEANQKTISADSGFSEIIINGHAMIKWTYTSHGHKFVEFFFTLDTYNMRVAFWALPGVLDRFYTVYLDIMSSLEFISRY